MFTRVFRLSLITKLVVFFWGGGGGGVFRESCLNINVYIEILKADILY